MHGVSLSPMPQRRIQDPDRLRALLDAVMLLESTLNLDDLLADLVERAAELVGASHGALGIIDVKRRGLERFITTGLTNEEVAAIGDPPSGGGLLGALIERPEALRLADASSHPSSTGLPAAHPPIATFLGAPVLVRGEAFGNLYLTNPPGSTPFTEEDEAVVRALAVAAGLAIESSRLYAEVEELGAAEARAALARDLHDTVLQRIFGHTMMLSALERRVDDPELLAAFEELRAELAETTRTIRSTIFGLAPMDVDRPLEVLVADVLAGLRGMFSYELEVDLEGLKGCELQPGLANALVVVLREGLTNVVRHANASACRLRVSCGEHLVVEIADNGTGGPSGSPGGGRGLGNLAHRARVLGGSCSFEPGETGGVLRWSVPLA